MAPLTRISVRQIIDQVAGYIEKRGINPRREKYRHLVLQEAEKYHLEFHQIKELASHLGITYFSPPFFAKVWIPSLCKTYMSMKYTNP